MSAKSIRTALIAAQREHAQRPSGYNTENRTDYVQSDGSVQAMASVLAQRAELAKLKGRKRLEAAFRFRAGLQGVLASCLCDYPLTHYETVSHHHFSCPATRIFESLLVSHAGET